MKKILIYVVAMVVALTMLVACSTPVDTEPDVKEYELVMAVGDGYVKEHQIEFERGAGTPRIYIPKLYIRSTDGKEREEVPYKELAIEGEDDILLGYDVENEQWYTFVQDNINQIYIDNTITFSYVGVGYEGVNEVSLRVRRWPVEAVGLEIRARDGYPDYIPVLQRYTFLTSVYTPSNASYTGTRWLLSGIRVLDENGEEMDNTGGRYAYFGNYPGEGEEEGNYISAMTRSINVGDEVGSGWTLYVVAWSGTGEGFETPIRNENEFKLEVV